MDNDTFSADVVTAARDRVGIYGFSPQISSDPLIESLVFNNQNQSFPRDTMASTFRGGSVSDFQTEIATANPPEISEHDAIVSTYTGFERNATADASIGSWHAINDSELRQQFLRGTATSTQSLPSVLPSEILRNCIFSDYSSSNPSYASSLNCDFNGRRDIADQEKDIEKFQPYLDHSERRMETTGLQSQQFFENPNMSRWISNNESMSTDNGYASSSISNDLSLRLTSSQPSIFCGSVTIPDQCSEISCSGATPHCFNETGIVSKQVCGSKELPLSLGSFRPAHQALALSGSRYLRAIQEILSEIAIGSLNDFEKKYPTCILASRRQPAGGEVSELPFNLDQGGIFEAEIEPELPRQDVESKKLKLLALLQLVDGQYNRCLDEIHTVISAFHAATELDPQVHARFALQTVSFMYKNLRERISNQILAMGRNSSCETTKEKEKSFEASFIQKQWAIQQLRRKESQLWRPQRGLPERSVSVLRAWLFQNFLHPYPKDSEKHILAVKSGLTRSQVSNWFINARVRLWKPMIEEMYSELNRRKAALQNDARSNSNLSNQISLDSQRFRLN